MKAKTLEKMFDEGEDVRSHLVLSKARRPGHEQRRQAKILDPQQRIHNVTIRRGR